MSLQTHQKKQFSLVAVNRILCLYTRLTMKHIHKFNKYLTKTN